MPTGAIEAVIVQKTPGGTIIVPSKSSMNMPTAGEVVVAPVAKLSPEKRPHVIAVVKVAADAQSATEAPWPAATPTLHEPRVAVIAVIADSGAAVPTPEPALMSHE